MKNMGINATVQNVNGFLASITKINKAIASQGGVITQVQAKFQTASARAIAADSKRIQSNNRVLKDIVNLGNTQMKTNAAVSVSNNKLISDQMKSNAKVTASNNKLASDKAKATASVKVSDQKTVQAQTKSVAQVQTATVKANAAMQVSANKLAAEQLKATAAVEAVKLKTDAAILASNDKVTIAQIKAAAQVEAAQIKADAQMKIAQMSYQQSVQSSSQVTANFMNKATGYVNKLAGSFKILSQAAGGIGGAIGTAIGGPGGGLVGGGIGSLLGSIGGAFINIPLQFLGVLGKGVLAVFNSITGAIKSVGGAINNLIFGPLSLFGLVLGTTVRDAVDGFMQLTSAVWDAAESYQALTISIQTLTAREIARQRQVDITDAITQEALGTTRALFDWMTKVSLTSPFTMQTIAQALKFSSAMGLSIKTTKNLVLATGNFAAAMGLEEDHQERIMYNLAQIYQQGKLTGREFRDLAISFVPVYDILREMAKEAGMETEAFKKLALEGGVPVEEFFDHFIGYMNRNFPNAMEKMSRTMTGVRNNIKDFIQVVLGMEVLKPTMDKISGALADVLNKLMTPEAHQIARDFGELLSSAFDNIRQGVNEVGNAVMNLMKTLGFVKPTVESIQLAFVRLYLNGRYALSFLASTINTVADAIKNYVIPALQQVGLFSQNGEGYGQSFMYNFAHGIIVGVAKFLAVAIIYVTSFIKAFFAPGSPPEVAPEIDKWGGAMMDSWMEGMVKESNWSILGKVGKTFGTEFDKYIPDQAITAPPDGKPNLAGGQNQGADPLEKPGKILSSVAKKSGKALSTAVAAVKTFVTEQGLKLAASFMHGFSSGMFDALDSIKGPLKDAISALTGLGRIGEVEGIEMFYNFTQDAIAALSEFNKTGVISQKLLGEIANLGMGLGPELAELVKREFELAGAVTAASLAQERLNAANKALNNAHKAVNILVRDYNNLLRAGTSRSTLKAKLAEVNAGEKVVASATAEQEAAQINKDLADERVTVLKEQADLQNKLVTNMIDLMNMQNEAINAAKNGAGDLANAMDDLSQQLGNMDISEVFKSLDPKELEAKFPGIKNFWETMSKDFADAFASAFKDADTQTAADTLMTNFKNSLANILGMPATFEVTKEGMADSLTKGANNLKPTGGKSYFQRIVDWIFGGNVDWSNAIDKVTTSLVGIVGGALDKLIKRILDPADPLNAIVIGGAVKLAFAFVKSFWGAVGDYLAGTQMLSPEEFSIPQEQVGQWLKGAGVSGNVVEQLFGKPTKEDITQWAKDTLEFDIGLTPNITITPAVNPFEQGRKSGEDYAAGVTVGMTNDASQKIIDTTSTNFFQKVWNSLAYQFKDQSPAQAMNPMGEDIVAGIMVGITNRATKISNPGGAISTEVNKIIGAFLDFFGLTDGATTTGAGSTFYNIGSAIVQGVVDGIESMEGAIEAAWEWAVGLLPEWARKLLDISSPSKVMEDIGQQAVLGFINGIKGSAKDIQLSMNAFAPQQSLMRYETATYTPSRTVDASSQVNISFGDVYINDNMDWAMFKSRVQRAITER